MGHLDNSPLGVAIEQDIGLGVDQQRVPHLVLPVVVMGDAAQRGFNTTEHNRHILESLPAALAVDQTGAIRALAALSAGGVSIIGTYLAISRVAVDH